MTVLDEIKMETKIASLEARVKELEEVVQAMGRLMVADQPQPQTQTQQYATTQEIPADIKLSHHSDCVLYLKKLGYSVVAGCLYINPDKTVRAQIVMDSKSMDYIIRFSRV